MKEIYFTPEREKLYNQFNKITGWHFTDYPFGFDVIALDNILHHREDYDSKKSCKENLEKMYGSQAVKLVNQLLSKI